MKTLKLLNKKNIILLIFFVFFNNSLANEPADIWNIDKSEIETNETDQINTSSSDEVSEEIISVYDLNNKKNQENQNSVLLENNLENKISLYGLYDPDENNLSIEMWNKSEGEEIKKIFNKIFFKNLSKDALDLLEIALLTNSNTPINNITRKDFYNFQKNFLIKNNNLDLIKLFIQKNPDFYLKDELINYYFNHYLEEANIEKSCEIFDFVGEATISNEYTSKLKIYCLINSDKIDQALLIYDLKKEIGLKDEFFESKIFKLIGFQETSNEISDKNLLELHLSHRVVEDFEYIPDENTSKEAWKYLASANLLEKIENIDLEDIEKINLIEKAVHEENYNEEDLFSLYTRYQFNFNQLLSAKENYKTLDKSSQRALIYQKMLLTIEPSEKLHLARLLKNLFEKDNLGNAFNAELSKIILDVDSTKISPELISFYEDNLMNQETEIKKIKFNNKIIHQSKLLNYFIEKKEISKIEKETNDLLKSVLKDKKYKYYK